MRLRDRDTDALPAGVSVAAIRRVDQLANRNYQFYRWKDSSRKRRSHPSSSSRSPPRHVGAGDQTGLLAAGYQLLALE